MRKLLLPAAGLVALSVLLSACEVQVTPYAARVGASTISASTQDGSMRAIADDTGYRCEVRAGSQDQLPIEGTGGSTYAASFAADVLTQLVEYRALHEEVARLGLHEGAFAREVAAAQLPLALNPASTSGCVTTGAQILASFANPYRGLIDQFEVDQLVVLAHLAGVTLSRAGITAYEAGHKASSTLSCTSVIQVASASAAAAARARVEAGASFASVARSSSTDPSASSGGSLGCVFASQFTSPLNAVVANLPVGQVSQPVAFGTGYLLLQVTSRPLAPVTQVASAVVLAQQAKLTTLIATVTSKSHVTVDPAFGTWTHASTGWSVTPPSGPPDALLPNPTAVTPAPAAVSPA